MAGERNRTAGVALFTMAVLVWLVAGAHRGVSASPQTAPSTDVGSADAGVYTEGQAERGTVVYLRSCSKCHGANLLGDSAEEIPALVGAEFIDDWAGEPLARLVDRIRTGMPGDKPGSLSLSECTDVVAYLLRSNGFSAGDRELLPDRNGLERIVLPRMPGSHTYAARRTSPSTVQPRVATVGVSFNL